MGFDLWIAFTFVISLAISVVFWGIFGLFSMKKIERGIMSEGKPRPCQWDPFWGRAIFYAWSVCFPAHHFSEMENQILNTADVKRYANGTDKVLGWILMVSTYTMIICGIISWIFGIGEGA